MKKFLIYGFLLGCCFLPHYTLAEEVVRIGLLGPMSGPLAEEGKQMKEVAELVAANLNAQGGVFGRKIQMVIADDQGTVEGGKTAARQLTGQRVAAVIGSYSSAVTDAVQGIFSQAGIPQISNASTAVPLSRKGIKTFFRICSNDEDQAQAAVEAILEGNYKRVAILRDSTLYSKGLADNTRSLLEQRGIQIAFDEFLPTDHGKYREKLVQMRETDPDVIFFAGYYPEAAVLLRQKRELRWQVPIIGGDASNNPDLINIAGKKAARGFQFLSLPRPGNLPSLKAKELLSQFRSEYGRRVSSIYAVLAGDALGVIAVAMDQTRSTDGGMLANYLLHDLKDYEGFTGQISFDKDGDREGQIFVEYQYDARGKAALLL